MKTESDLEVNGRVRSIPVFRVVVVYDDFASGRCAIDVCNRFVSEWRENFNFHIKMWSFNLLRNPEVNAAAVDEAAEAQMVVVSTPAIELPPPVKKWTEAWVFRKGGRCGLLVALLSPQKSDRSRPPAESYLRTAAASGGMEFVLGGIHHIQDWSVVVPKVLSRAVLN